METSDQRSDELTEAIYKNIADAIESPEVVGLLSQIFYHYTDAAGLLGILKSDSPVLRFSRFDCLNDTSEGQDIDEHFQSVCKELIKNSIYDKKMIKSIMKCKPNDEVVIPYDHQEIDIRPLENEDDLYTRKPFAKIGVFNVDAEVYMCCFSSMNDLLPMWNYYSNGNAFQGYCIGFKPEMFNSFARYAHNSAGIRIDGCKFVIVKVIYEDKEKNRILLERVSNILDYVSMFDYSIEDAKELITSMLNSLRFVFKKSIFSHENEFRVILYKPKQIVKYELDETKLPQIEYRSRKGIITPYVELHFIGCKLRVKNVTIGPLIEKDVARKTTKDFLDNRKYRAEIINSTAPIR